MNGRINKNLSELTFKTLNTMKRVYQILSNYCIEMALALLVMFGMLIMYSNDISSTEEAAVDELEQIVSNHNSIEEIVLEANEDITRSDFSRTLLYFDGDCFEAYPYSLDNLDMLIGTIYVDYFTIINSIQNVFIIKPEFVYQFFNNTFVTIFNTTYVNSSRNECWAVSFWSPFLSPFTWRRARAPGHSKNA